MTEEPRSIFTRTQPTAVDRPLSQPEMLNHAVLPQGVSSMKSTDPAAGLGEEDEGFALQLTRNGENNGEDGATIDVEERRLSNGSAPR